MRGCQGSGSKFLSSSSARISKNSLEKMTMGVLGAGVNYNCLDLTRDLTFLKGRFFVFQISLCCDPIVSWGNQPKEVRS